MQNIINSDIYRLKNGAAMRNTLIGLLFTVLFVGVVMNIFTSDGLAIYLDKYGTSVTQQDTYDVESMVSDIESMRPRNAADFGREILSSNFWPFFFLPVIIAVFCADFTHGTYRNLLSYIDNRGRIYFAKLLLSIICCIAICLISMLFSWFVGWIFFGFGGFTAEYFKHTAVTFLLMIPSMLSLICLGHCLVAFTKKSSSTIAIFLISPVLLSLALQALAMLPRLGMLVMFDCYSIGKLFIEYWTLPIGNILISVCASAVIVVVTTILGVTHYRKADLN